MAATGKSPTTPSVAVPATCFEDIDNTILVEILGRAFPSFQFGFNCKLVSKRWCSVISSTIFAKRWKSLHKPYSPEDPPYPFALLVNIRIRQGEDKYIINYVASGGHPVFRSPRLKLDFLPCSKPRKASSSRIAASCDDLLLCHAVSHRMDLEPRVYYLCNPLTQQWAPLPAPFPAKYPFMTGVAVGLVVGDNNDSYSVARIRPGRPPSGNAYWQMASFIAEVFSSQTGKWEEWDVPHPHGLDFDFEFFSETKKKYTEHNLLSWNGLLVFENKEDHSIVAYNPLEPDRCHIIHTPRDPAMRKTRAYKRKVEFMILGVCRGSLRIVQHIDTIGGGRGFLNIWELTGYETGEWIFKSKIFFDEFITDDDPLLRCTEVSSDSDDDDYVSQSCALLFTLAIQVLAVDPNHEDIVYFYLKDDEHVNRRIFSCNLETKLVQVFDDKINQRSVDGWLRNLFPYVVPGWPTPVPTLLGDAQSSY